MRGGSREVPGEWIGRAAWGAALALVAACLVSVLGNPTRFLFDDAYFYLQIARHMADGDGSTFHGVGYTNGYHPLWLGICVPVVYVCQALGVSALRGALLVQVGLAGGIAWAGARLARVVSLPYPELGGALLAVYLLAGGVWGSEGFLNAFLQLAGLGLVMQAHRDRASASGWVAAGAVIGLAVLARLDLVFLAAACCASAWVQPGVKGRHRVRDALLLGGAITAVLLPYLVTNLVNTGHLMPVSGAVKSTFPVPDPRGVAFKLGALGRNVAVGAVLAGGLAWFRAHGPLRRALLITAAGTLAHAAYVALFTVPGWSTDYDYYYVVGAVTLAGVASVGFDAFTVFLPSLSMAQRRRVAVGLALVMLAGGAGRAVDNAFAFGAGGPVLEPEPIAVRLARWMGARLPHGSVVFTVDAPGRLAWFSGVPVLAADGLTHDRAFAVAVRAGGLDRWLQERGTTHVVLQLYDYRVPWVQGESDGERALVQVLGPEAGEPVGTFEVRAADALVLTSDLGDDQAAGERVGVWRWPVP